jgi:ribosome biogenesis GTPase / thiamine phosphate phosphatase
MFGVSTPLKFGSLVVGDLVTLEENKGEHTITSLHSRGSVFYRSFDNRTKLIASNVDHVYLLTAPPPLFNSTWLDRAITAAFSHGMSCSLILNKCDLTYPESLLSATEVYQKIGVPVVSMSVTTNSGVLSFKKMLCDEPHRMVLFCGISGVGKSSLLNALLPEAERKIGELSDKSGHGKQTTSLAHGFSLNLRERGAPLFVIDAPGLQNFGLSHLTVREALLGFPEFIRWSQECRFSTCTHSHEKECGVQHALEQGNVLSSRYNSYLNILHELVHVEENRYK